jgi:hypothetical protein
MTRHRGRPASTTDLPFLLTTFTPPTTRQHGQWPPVPDLSSGVTEGPRCLEIPPPRCRRLDIPKPVPVLPQSDAPQEGRVTEHL